MRRKKLVGYGNEIDKFFDKFTGCAKVCGLFFLDCAFWVLIGWEGKLQSLGCSFTEG